MTTLRKKNHHSENLERFHADEVSSLTEERPNRRLKFILVQTSCWLLFHGVVFFPMHGLATMLGATTLGVVILTFNNMLSAILISSAMAVFYSRLPSKYLQGGFALATIFLASLSGSIIVASIELIFASFTDLGPWLPPQMQEVPFAFPIILLLRGTMIFGTWSAAFLVILLGQRVRIERERVAVASELAKEAQLQLLRSQLNPHFLFNALNSIIALVTEEPRRAKQMVRDLAKLLRRSLDDRKKTDHRLRAELEFIQLYIRCEKVRFEERLCFDVEIPESLFDEPFPNMLLQPLVENTIKHGMKGPDPLTVKLRGREENGEIILEVMNTGHLTRELEEATLGVGLRSVRERIRVLFPGRGRFELREEGGWVIACIRYTPTQVALP